MKYFPDISSKWALIVIFIVFLLPELMVWGVVDSFKEPIRSYSGDTAHYMTVLNSALTKGGPEGNSFLYEEQEHGSRFFVFEVLMGTVNKILPLSLSVWAIVLQVLVPLLVFYTLYSIFTVLGIEEKVASSVSLLHVLVYGVVVYSGYGLAFWFIPFLLLGVWVIVSSAEKSTFTSKQGLFLAFSIILFTLHPAYFVFGGAITFIAWLLLIKRHGTRTIVPYALIWLVVSVAIFMWLYFPMLADSVANNDLLVRMALINTRFPIHPIQMVQTLVVGIALFLHRRSGILTAAFLVSFIALLVPTITGSYLVNDHYVIAADYLVLAAALLLIYSDVAKKYALLGSILLLTTLIDIFLVLQYFNFKLGYYGKYITIHASFLAISLILTSPDIRAFMRRVLASKRLRFFLVCLAILYASLLQYKDYVGAHLALDLDVQAYRPLIDELRSLPPGVVLADNGTSFLVPIFTDHKIYWSSLASSQPAPTLNLLTRFEDAHLFFPDDKSHEPPAVIGYIFGAIEKCREFNRKDVLEKLAVIGFEAPLAELCAPTRERQARYDALKDVLEERYNRTLASQKWQPAFKADYLILTEEDKQVPPWLIEKYFTEIDRVAGAVIYSYDK